MLNDDGQGYYPGSLRHGRVLTEAEFAARQMYVCLYARAAGALGGGGADAAGASGSGGVQPGSAEGGWPESEARGSARDVVPKRRRNTTSARGAVDGADAEAEAQVAAPRRSARVAARTEQQRFRSRIVSGFGDERVDDVAADEANRIAAGAGRGDARRNEGTRGRMTDFTGADLDRGAGGAWHAGRR